MSHPVYTFAKQNHFYHLDPSRRLKNGAADYISGGRTVKTFIPRRNRKNMQGERASALLSLLARIALHAFSLRALAKGSSFFVLSLKWCFLPSPSPFLSLSPFHFPFFSVALPFGLSRSSRLACQLRPLAVRIAREIRNVQAERRPEAHVGSERGQKHRPKLALLGRAHAELPRGLWQREKRGLLLQRSLGKGGKSAMQGAGECDGCCWV